MHPTPPPHVLIFPLYVLEIGLIKQNIAGNLEFHSELLFFIIYDHLLHNHEQVVAKAA